MFEYVFKCIQTYTSSEDPKCDVNDPNKVSYYYVTESMCTFFLFPISNTSALIF